MIYFDESKVIFVPLLTRSLHEYRGMSKGKTLISIIMSPHKASAKVVHMFGRGHSQEPYLEISPLDGDRGLGFHKFCACVKGDHGYPGAAFYFKRNNPVVWYNYRPHSEGMWGNRCDNKGGRAGENDGAATTQAISCGSCWGSHDEPISPIGVQKFPVDVSVNRDHLIAIGLVDGQVVDPMGIFAKKARRVTYY